MGKDPDPEQDLANLKSRIRIRTEIVLIHNTEVTNYSNFNFVLIIKSVAAQCTHTTIFSSSSTSGMTNIKLQNTGN
jgi:hypothetical protein